MTCLPCREHAAAEHLRYADQVRRLARMTGSVISGEEADEAARWAARHGPEIRELIPLPTVP